MSVCLETKAKAAKHMPSTSVTQIGRQYHEKLACVVGVWENLIGLTRQQPMLDSNLFWEAYLRYVACPQLTNQELK